jgi:uncharacterized protein (DUF4213/DUF364 family)
MGLLADLLASVSASPPYVATAAVAGRRFTAVGGALAPHAPPGVAGLAYTAQGEDDPAYDPATASAALTAAATGRPILDLARELVPDGAAAGPQRPDLGAAALNALLGAAARRGDYPLGEENGLDLVVRLSAGKRLAMVGRFPYLDGTRLTATRCWVLELSPEGDDLPATAAPEILPQADVVGMTGSTLANGTLEGLLALCRRDATVVLIGPTTPLSPVLFDYGADVLCGAVVDDPPQTLAVLADGALKPRPRIPGTRVVSLTRP